MIRVLHLIQTLQLGGAERNLYNLVRSMDAGIVENHVGYCHGGEFEPIFRDAGIRLFKYSDKRHKIVSVETLLAVFRTLAYVKRNRIQIIHTHNFNAHLLGLIVAKLSGGELIEHVHDFRYIEKAERERGYSFVKQFDHAKWIKGFSDRVVVLTQQNVDFLLRNQFYGSDRIRLIRNGIPMDGAAPSNAGLKERLGIPEGWAVLLTPVRMSDAKNLDLLFRVVPAVAAKFPKTVFIAAGDGPKLETYKRRAQSERLERNLFFIGFYPETLELLAISDVMILPSFLELHSISVLEALSMKVPVVTSRSAGCNNEIFHHEKDGILLDPFSPDEWIEPIVRLLESPDKRRAIGEAGYALCREQFGMRNAARKLEELYEELVPAARDRKK